MDRFEQFRKFCEHVNETEKSPRSLQAYWSLKFMEEFEKHPPLVLQK